MDRLRTLLARIRAMLRGVKLDESLDAEMRSHLEMLAEEKVRRGMTPEEARYAARCEFGGVEQNKQAYREQRGIPFLETLVQDVRFAVRLFAKSPGFAAIAILTLALGIGANTAIFSVVDAVLLRPLPYKDPARLVWATEHFPFGPSTVVSADFPAWRDRNHVFEQMAASGGTSGANLTGIGEPARVSITNVTSDFFPMLGVRPIVGRLFLADEAKRGQEHVALLNETLWRNRFAADPRVIGQTIRLDDTAYTIVGVIPASMRPQADLWTPFAMDSEIFSPHSPRWMMLSAVGRMKPGVQVSQTQSDLQVLAQEMDKEYPPEASQFRRNLRVEVIPLHELFVQNVRSLLLILLAATAFVLLIACANVANLLLARGVARGREIAVRTALGAGRMRLVRQLLTEGLVLVLVGGLLGTLIGLWATRILRQLIPANLPVEVGLDPRILAFSAAIAGISLLLFGVAPALIASRSDVNETLKEGGLRLWANSRTNRVRGLMSAVEIALSLILMVGAGLLVRSFVRLTDVDLGFDPHGLLVATVERPVTPGTFNSSQHAAFFEATLERIRNLPGVKAAALTERYPLGPLRNATLQLRVQGAENFRPPQPILITAVSPEYFQVMKVRLLSGRAFSNADVTAAQPVVILNKRLARLMFGNRDPLGQRIAFGDSSAPWTEIVGVVDEMRQDALEQEPAPEVFVPFQQHPTFAMSIVLRTDSSPELLANSVRSAVESIDKNQPVSEVAAMDEVVAQSVAPRRFRMSLVGLFAILAFLLAMIGIYGVIAYSCTQRTYEFGIRVALGAERKDIFRIILWQALVITAFGVAIGVAGAIGLTRYLASLLYTVKPTDPLTFVIVAAALTVVALLAAYLPARRALRVDPIAALRHE